MGDYKGGSSKITRAFDELWKFLSVKFQKTKKPISLNFKDVVISKLKEKRSDVYTHYIHSYPGKLFPYIPLFWLSIPGICSPTDIVLDPFTGSGTVMLESIIHPLYKRNVFGVEINPLAQLISKVKTTPLHEKELINKLQYLLRLVRDPNNKKVPVRNFKNINFWFSKTAISKLSILKHSIEKLEDSDYKDFFWVCFSSIIRKVSKADPFIPPPVKLKIYKYKNSPQKYKFLIKFLKQTENPDIIGLFESVTKANIKRIMSLNGIEEIKKGRVTAKVIWNDARHIKMGEFNINRKNDNINNKNRSLRSRSIGLILTSPPYLTAQKYIRTQKLELLWLDLLSEDELRYMEKESIGSERVSLNDVNLDTAIDIKAIDSLISWTRSVSVERAATLYKYFIDMKQAIKEMYRVLKDGAYAIVIVGNNRVLGKRVETYKLLIDLALASGFRLNMILKDKIRRRGMIAKRHNSGGLIKEEFILIFKKEE